MSSSWAKGLIPGPVHVEFMVDNVLLGHTPEYIGCTISASFHKYSIIIHHHWPRSVFATDIIVTYNHHPTRSSQSNLHEI